MIQALAAPAKVKGLADSRYANSNEDDDAVSAEGEEDEKDHSSAGLALVRTPLA